MNMAVTRGKGFTRLALWLVGAAAVACNRGYEMRSGSLSPWNDLDIPGVELFVQRGAGGHDAVPMHGAARVAGSGRVLTGKEAFDAARAHAGADPTVLATLAMLFVDEQTDGVVGHRPWTGRSGTLPADEEAIATPPRLSGHTLEYWRRHAVTDDLVRCRVALDSGKTTCELARGVLHAQQLHADPYKLIDAELASNNTSDQVLGVQDLASIGDDAARQRLIDLALDAYSPRTRAAAAEALGKLPGPGVVEALQRVEKYDKSGEASMAAHRALQQLEAGGRNGRPP